jgi:hypothetical protein
LQVGFLENPDRDDVKSIDWGSSAMKRRRKKQDQTEGEFKL